MTRMTYEEVKERFKEFGNYCDDYCDGSCEKCSDMEDRIINALDKQIPKKVRKYKANPTLIYFECPCCGHKIHADIKFCRYCGQALDWSEVDE